MRLRPTYSWRHLRVIVLFSQPLVLECVRWLWGCCLDTVDKLHFWTVTCIYFNTVYFKTGGLYIRDIINHCNDSYDVSHCGAWHGQNKSNMAAHCNGQKAAFMTEVRFHFHLIL